MMKFSDLWLKKRTPTHLFLLHQSHEFHLRYIVWNLKVNLILYPSYMRVYLSFDAVCKKYGGTKTLTIAPEGMGRFFQYGLQYFRIEK
jgi:hypothetical protein